MHTETRLIFQFEKLLPVPSRGRVPGEHKYLEGVGGGPDGVRGGHPGGGEEQERPAAEEVAHAADHGRGDELEEAEEGPDEAAEQHRVELLRRTQVRPERLHLGVQGLVEARARVVLPAQGITAVYV